MNGKKFKSGNSGSSGTFASLGGWKHERGKRKSLIYNFIDDAWNMHNL